MIDAFKNPVVLVGGAAGVFVVFLLMRNKSSSTVTSQVTNPGQSAATSPVAPGTAGGGYTWLDGSGMEHIVATDPNGQLTTYTSDPTYFDPYLYAGQLSSYSSYNWASTPYTNPYGGHTPYYSQQP